MPEPASWFFWQAYHHLRGSRRLGMGPGGIPFSEIMEYAENCGLTCPVHRNRLVRMVTDMDNAEIEMARSKA